MRTWKDVTREFQRLTERRDELLEECHHDPEILTPQRRGDLERLNGRILALLQEPIERAQR